jgi:hypothetical protein
MKRADVCIASKAAIALESLAEGILKRTSTL